MKRARDPDLFRQAIEARKLTHREVAKLADCSLSTVGFVLAGRATSNGNAARLARVVRRPVNSLFVVAVSSDEQPNDPREAVA